MTAEPAAATKFDKRESYKVILNLIIILIGLFFIKLS